ncbi:hypothetical protein ACLOJK_018120 [Asimina triloba]
MAALHGAFSSVIHHGFHVQNPNSSSKSRNLPTLTIVAEIQQQKSSSNDSSLSDKKSFAVATGKLFSGLASRLLKRVNSNLSSVLDGRNGLGLETYPRERIASVVEDLINPDVIWGQRLKDVEAERKRKAVTSPGFSFSAAGLLFPYHLGVAQFLLEKGYIKESTPLAGSSAGAIVCAVIASGSSMQDALKATKVLAEDCRLKGTAFRLGLSTWDLVKLQLCFVVRGLLDMNGPIVSPEAIQHVPPNLIALCDSKFHMQAVLRDILEKFLPDDVHIRSNGRVRVAVTQILWKPRGLLVDHFDSKEDLINAVVTSSFIPGYLAPRPATLFRNRLCVDGGLTLFMPPTSASKTVRVCAFPAERLGLRGIGISPDCNPENRATPRELFKWALEPAEDEILERLFQLGCLDAAVWAGQNPLEETVHDDHVTESA